jgi:DNA-binding transcriptional LysR family regulator
MNIRSLDLRLLQCLDALITERNVTRAAARVHLSQPATSNALKRLREIFRDPLLTKSARGLIPTPRGTELACAAREILASIQAMAKGTRPFDPATCTRTFRLSMTDYSEFVLLPSLIARLQTEAPSVNLAVTQLNIRTTADELADGDADVAIANFRNLSPRLQARELFRERFVCLVNKGNTKVGRRLTLERFTELAHVFVSPRGGGFYGVTDYTLAALDRARRIAVSVPHFLVAPFLVAEADLIIVTPERVARHFAAALPLRILEPPVPVEGFPVSLLWHERSKDEAGAVWLRGLISKVSTQPRAAPQGARRAIREIETVA